MAGPTNRDIMDAIAINHKESEGRYVEFIAVTKTIEANQKTSTTELKRINDWNEKQEGRITAGEIAQGKTDTRLDGFTAQARKSGAISGGVTGGIAVAMAWLANLIKGG